MSHSPRIATAADIIAMHKVRCAVLENRLTSTAITEADYAEAIERTGRGWVVEVDGVVAGFSVGNGETGNIWALFVAPDFEGLGIGRSLQDVMMEWLFNRGLTRVYLTTEPGTRAQRFYEASGWTFVETDDFGDAVYERRFVD